ncbi:MAG: hypothetical protein Q4B99_03730 [Clostridia bacterium]|nr:hypothetical protein [Clostridia bacterium]
MRRARLRWADNRPSHSGTIAVCAAAVALALLFTLPAARVRNIEREAAPRVEAARELCLSGDMGAAAKECARLAELLAGEYTFLSSIIDNDLVDALMLRAYSSLDMAHAGDVPQLLCELRALEEALYCATRVESFSFDMVL